MLKTVSSFLTESQKSIGSILKVLILSQFNSRIEYQEQHKSLVILGTGPSFKKTIENDLSQLKENDLLGLNHFAEKNEFEYLKPNNYLVGAPEMWRENLDEFYTEKSIRFFNALNSKTNWPLTLYLAIEANKSKRLDIIKKNAFIKIVFYNDTPIEGLTPINHFLFNRKLGMPRPHNVMIPAIMIGMWRGYNKIILVGADHSWHEMLRIKDDNTVELDQKHYFDTKENWATMKYAGKRDRKIHEIFEKCMLAFKGYIELESYSQKKKIKIYNASYKSYIDAFERVFLNDIN